MDSDALKFSYLLFKDKLVEEDHTCVKLQLKQFDEILAVQAGKGGGGRGNALIWRRFPPDRHRLDSTWYMPTGTNFDALKFKARRAVRIIGIGAFGPITSRHNLNWKLGIRYKLEGGEESAWGIYTPQESDKDDLGVYKIFYSDIDLPDLTLQAEESFFVFQNLQPGHEHSHHGYGEGGEKSWYDNWPEHSPDFETAYANGMSTNGTDQNRG